MTRLLFWYKIWARLYDTLLDKLFGFDREHVVSYVKGKKVIEVGVGTGLNLPYYTKTCNVTGIDFSPDMLRKAKAKAGKNVILKRMDAMNMKFKKNSFDGALLTYVVRVMPDPVKMMKEIQRVTKPGARIVIYDNFSRKPGFSFWNLFEKIGWGRNYILNDLIKGTKLKIIKKERNLVVLENGKT